MRAGGLKRAVDGELGAFRCQSEKEDLAPAYPAGRALNTASAKDPATFVPSHTAWPRSDLILRKADAARQRNAWLVFATWSLQ
jgi:hypothetical protein